MKYSYSSQSIKTIFNTIIFTIILIISSGHIGVVAQSSNWKAPTVAKTMINPFLGNKNATLAGKGIYKQQCAICHGTKGRGDGLAGISLKPRPANFTKKLVQNQSDGEIFWKLTEGKPPMAPYKQILSEDQRWQLVNYIRTFKKK